MNDILSHNKKDDCWVVIDNFVYDITEFLDIHPGGKRILISVSGGDVSDYFYELHKESILSEIGNDYKIGYIVDCKL